jgi:hypothetical protein
MSEDRSAPAAKFETLAVPGREHGGYEVLRAAVAEGNLHVSLRRAFDALEVCEIRLADGARHIGRIYALEAGLCEEDVVEEVRVLFAAETELPTDIGRTNATR